ncbi:MAG: hypothetical protein QOF40_2682 [Actinomycetota bacterium]|jgi:hypothetical protein|nr:hypothetical protein [Actinomycetota bacterium]
MKWLVVMLTVVAGLMLGAVPASASTCIYAGWDGTGTQVCTP